MSNASKSRVFWQPCRLLALLTISASCSAQGQTWEKLIAPGLVYRAEVDTALPRMIHGLRWTPKAKAIQAVPELAGATVYEDNASKGRETVSSMAQRTGAIAAINADFFPFTGDPLGMMVRGGELLSLPFPGRSAFGWGAGGSAQGTMLPSLTFGVEGSVKVAVPQFNEECKANSLSVNTERAGIARSSTQTCVHAILRITEGNWKVGSKVRAEVQLLSADASAVPVAPGQCVVTATGAMMPTLAGLRPGEQVVLDLRVDGFDWTKVDSVVGGGPALVMGGAVAIDATEQGFDAAFSEKRHPRSAVGRTKEGDIWWLAIDGRQALSAGATLEELARVMQRLGCIDAINLDGGGSTALNILGLTVNRPSEGKEREVANGVVFLGPTPPREDVSPSIRTPGGLIATKTAYLQVVDGKGATIPNSEVIWGATGSGWIDQGGFLRATAEGTVFVTAWTRGQIVSTGLEIGPAPPPDRGRAVQNP